MGSGGAERVASILINSINEIDGARVKVITLDGDAKFYTINNQVEMLCIPGYSYSISILRMPMMLWQIIWLSCYIFSQYPESSDVRIIGFLHRANIVSVVAGYFTKIKVIISERSLFSFSYKGVKSKIMKIILRKAYSLPCKIIAISSVTKQSIIDNFHVANDRIKIINNPSYIAPLFRVKAPSKVTNLLFVGRLIRSKNVEFLLNCMLRLNFESPAYNLTVVGDGPKLNSLKAFASKNNLHENVKFIGSSRDVISFYNEAHIFVFASEYESFGNVLVEACSHGLPVVISNQNDGRCDIFPHENAGAIYYEKNNIDSFVNSVHYLSMADQWLYFSKNATINAKRFEEKLIISKYLDEIYN